jgi:hypothetical protein
MVPAVSVTGLQASLLTASIQELQMFEFRYPPAHRLDDQHFAAVRKIIAEVSEAQQRLGYRAGNQVIIDKIGLDAQFVLDEGYWREALDYHLGLLYAHVGDPEKAAYHFGRSDTHPSTGGNQVFADHQRESLELRRRQDQARERGIPSLAIAAMPRSASASLTQTLGAMLDAPRMRVSCGSFPKFYLVPRWLNSFSPGGAILHDHFGATSFNLKALREGRIPEVFVRIRDPRPAAASAVNLSNQKYGVPGDIDHESQVIQYCEQSFIPWVADWIAAPDTATGLKIHWLTQPSNAVADMVRQILTTLLPEYPVLAQYLGGDVDEVRANFVTGDNDAWREVVSDAGQERLWHAIPQNVKNFLRLKL